MSPTVGSIIPYVPGEKHGDVCMARNADGALPAIVVAVWSETCANLVIFDANGNQHTRTSVPIHQHESGAVYGEFPGDPVPVPETEPVEEAAPADGKDPAPEAPEVPADPAPQEAAPEIPAEAGAPAETPAAAAN